MNDANGCGHDILLFIAAALFILFATGLAGPARFPTAQLILPAR